MRRIIFSCGSALVFAVLAVHATLFPEEIDQETSAAFFAPGDAPFASHYAPDRAVQILHLQLDVTPDFARRTVSGKAVYRLKPIAKSVAELQRTRSI